ncbi:MAG: hypothetical protein D6B26_01820 [Spirochaetaceae bacterium]|nr:MAG: hypothetical protein D6B26_01820 [Spirochaetaceae bacterium]
MGKNTDKRMRVLLLAVVTLLIPFGIYAQADDLQAVARSVSGEVEYRTADGDWQPLEVGDSLPKGATISTGFHSSAVLEIGQAVLEVAALSRMTLDELVDRGGVIETDLFLEVGRIRADVKRTSNRRQNFRLRSTVATAAVRGTSFSFDGRNLQVYEGVVALSNSSGRTALIPAGNKSSVSGSEAPLKAQRAAQEAVLVVHDTAIKATEPGEQAEILVVEDDAIEFDADVPISTGTVVVEFE